MSLTTVQYPAKRLTYEGQGDPIFSGDIRTANELLLSAIVSLIDNPTGFYIISGMAYRYAGYGYYTAGIIYYNGALYYVPANILEGKYLSPSTTDIMPKLDYFGRTVNIYKTYQCTQSDVAVGTIPVLSGTMNTYRVNFKILKDRLDALYNRDLKVSGTDFNFETTIPAHPITGTVKIIREKSDVTGRLVTVIAQDLAIHPDWKYNSIFIIPVSYRPSTTISVISTTDRNSENIVMQISSSGEVVTSDTPNAYSRLYSFTAQYIVP